MNSFGSRVGNFTLKSKNVNYRGPFLGLREKKKKNKQKREEKKQKNKNKEQKKDASLEYCSVF